MKTFFRGLLIALATFAGILSPADAAMKGAVGARKMQVGLNIQTYYVGNCPMLNWMHCAGGPTVFLSAGGQASGIPVWNKGYINPTTGEAPNPLPSAVGSYSYLLWQQDPVSFLPFEVFNNGTTFNTTSALTADWLGSATATITQAGTGGSANSVPDTSGVDGATGRTYITFHLGASTTDGAQFTGSINNTTLTVTNATGAPITTNTVVVPNSSAYGTNASGPAYNSIQLNTTITGLGTGTGGNGTYTISPAQYSAPQQMAAYSQAGPQFRIIPTNPNDPPRSVRVYQTKFKSRIDAGEKWNPEWKQLLRPFGRVRWMDPLATNNSVLTDYSQYATENYVWWGGISWPSGLNSGTGPLTSYPLSAIASIALEMGNEVHFNIPFTCTDTCVTSIATYFRDAIPKGGPAVLYELSNEVWNSSFSGASRNTASGPNSIPGGSNIGNITGSIAGTTLTVTATTGAGLGSNLFLSGTGITPNTYVVAQLTGSGGAACPDPTCTWDIGTYSVSVSQTVGSETIAVGRTLIGQYLYALARGVTEPASRAVNKLISNITPGNPTTITTSTAHGFSGLVSFQTTDPIYGPVLNLNTETITSTGANTFTIAVDTTGLGAYTDVNGRVSNQSDRHWTYYGYRSAQVMDIIRGVYGDRTRWKGGLGTQITGNSSILQNNLVGVNAYLTQVGGGLTVHDLFDEVLMTCYTVQQGGIFNPNQLTAVTNQTVGVNTPLATTVNTHNLKVGQIVKFLAPPSNTGMVQLANTFATVTSVPTASTFAFNIDTSLASFTATIDNGSGVAGNILTVSGWSGGQILPNSGITGAGLTAGTKIVGYGTGTGGNGTYFVNNSQLIASESMTTGAFTGTGFPYVAFGSPFQLMDQSAVNFANDPTHYPTKYTYFNQTIAAAAQVGYSKFNYDATVYPFSAGVGEIYLDLPAAFEIAVGKATTFTSSISGGILTASAVSGGTIAVGDLLQGAGNVFSGIIVAAQLTGTAGGAGTYQLGGNGVTNINVSGIATTIIDGSFRQQNTVALANGLKSSQYEGGWNFSATTLMDGGNHQSSPQYNEFMLYLDTSPEIAPVMNGVYHGFENMGNTAFSSQYLETGNIQPGNPWSGTRNFPGDIRNGRWTGVTAYSRGIQ